MHFSGFRIWFWYFLALTRNTQRRAAKANLKKHHREHYHITRRLHQQHPMLRSITTATTTAATIATTTITTSTTATTTTTTTTTYQLEKKVKCYLKLCVVDDDVFLKMLLWSFGMHWCGKSMFGWVFTYAKKHVFFLDRCHYYAKCHGSRILMYCFQLYINLF